MTKEENEIIPEDNLNEDDTTNETNPEEENEPETYICEHHKKNFPEEKDERPKITKHVHHKDENHKNNAPDNKMKLCCRCHSLYHGISMKITEIRKAYELFKDIQHQRIRTQNNIRATMALELPVPEELNEHLKHQKETEDKLEKKLIKFIREEMIYKVWLSKVKGITETTSGGLLAYIGNINRFDTISKLWSYCGYGLHDGLIQKPRSGVKITYNPKMKCLLYNISEIFMKNKNRDSKYGLLYDPYKAAELAKGCRPIIAHRRALRKISKIFLKDLWLVWRNELGLSITQPYELKLGHSFHPPFYYDKEVKFT